MIDLVKAEKVFKSYVEKYNTEDDKIELKIKHTYGVVSMSGFIATKLGLDEENIKLAKLIALLHDIGRFEQAKKYDCFIDSKEIDHAEYGVEILFENNLIRTFIKDKKYDNIILKAIKNHNKYEIEEGLSEEELLHSKIIRDADKTDNLRIKYTEEFETLFDAKEEEIENEKISDKVYEDFMNHKQIRCEDRVTHLDFWVCFAGWIYDFNFDIGIQYIKDNECIDKLIDRIDYKDPDTKKKMKEIKKHAKKYLNKVKLQK